MKGYLTNIEDGTLKKKISGESYIGEKFTAGCDNLRAKKEIGEETHTLDQFIRVEAGRGVAVQILTLDNHGDTKTQSSNVAFLP
jgi:hypothetical protein